MSFRSQSHYWFAVLCVVFVAACRSESRSPSPAAAPSITPPFELSRAIDQMRLPIRATADGYRIERPAYTALISKQGQLQFQVSGAGIALELRTGALQRSGAAMKKATRGVVAQPSPTEVIVNQSLGIEHWSATSKGVEQSWSFGEQPKGDGPLQVRVTATGVPFARASTDGLHFASADRSIRYGIATWRDASGRETVVIPKFDHGEIVIEVPASVVDESAYPAVLDPLIEPEFYVDAPVYANRTKQRAPAVAFDGTNYFVVWRDMTTNVQCSIVGARVSPAGVILDQPPLPLSFPSTCAVSAQSDEQNQIGVAFNGTSYMVVWDNGSVNGVLVNPDGTVKSKSAIKIFTETVNSSSSGKAYNPTVTTNGSDFFVIWHMEGSGGLKISAARYASNGTRIGGATPIVVGPSYPLSLQPRPSVTYANATYFVSWVGSAARVSDAGVLLDTTPINTGATGNPSVTTNGSEYAIAWISTSPMRVNLARYDFNGVALDPTPIAIPVPASVTGLRDVEVISSGNSYLVAWTQADSGGLLLAGARVDSTGAVTAAFSLAQDPSSHRLPALAAGSTGTLIAWEGPAVTGANVTNALARRLDASDTLLDPSPLVLGQTANIETDGALTFDGSQFLAVWRDLRAGAAQLFGTRVTSSGVVLNAAFQIASDTAGLALPRVSSGGGISLVSWTNRNGVHSVRLDPNGSVLDTTPITVAGSANAPMSRSAWNGQSFTLVWAKDGRLLTTRIGVDGTVLDPTPTLIVDEAVLLASLPSVTPYLASLDLACLPSGTCLVTWRDARQSTQQLYLASAYAARLTNAGAVLDPDGFPLNVDPNNPGTVRECDLPTVTVIGGDFLTVWRDPSSGLAGTRVSATGTVLDSPPALLTSTQRTPLAVGTGTKALLLVRYSTSSSTSTTQTAASSIDWTATGPVIDQFHPVSSSLNPLTISAAWDGQTRVMMLATHPSPTDRVSRVYGQFINLAPMAQGSVCHFDYDCTSGFCIDGVCCDTSCGDNLKGSCQACSAAKGASADGVCTPLTAVACDSGTPCAPGLCSAGTCVATPLMCTAADACHTAGVCDSSTGKCSNPTADDGTACDDASACTQHDVCASGICVGDEPVICTASDACHLSGTCDPTTGACSTPAAENGTVCEAGTCQEGLCEPTSPDGGAPETPDAGPGMDAGEAPDAGETLHDAGVSRRDGGLPDASIDHDRPDAGAVDVSADAGDASQTVPVTKSCGCQSPSIVHGIWLGLLLLRRRKRLLAGRP